MAWGASHMQKMRHAREKREHLENSGANILMAFDEDLPKNCTCTFVDFVAFATSEFYSYGSFEGVSYSDLIDFSNEWLQKNDCWDVIGCETIPATIELHTNHGQLLYKKILTMYTIEEDASTHVEHQNTTIKCRGPTSLLRLWISRLETDDNTDDKLRPIIPQIQFKDFIPKRIKDNEFENIDSVVERINTSIRNEEIHGKIISVQTLACCANHDWNIEENTTQSKSWIGKMVYILRVFFSLGPIDKEEIGFVDFVPECRSGGNLFSKPRFEPQSELLKRASKWMSENPNINFCNSSSIDVKLKSMDTKKMAINRGTGDLIRFMRIVYTKPAKVSVDKLKSPTHPPPPPIYMESRSFVLDTSFSDLKRTLADFMSRDEWTAHPQFKWIFLNFETVSVFTPSSAEDMKSSLESNVEESFQAISASNSSINRNLFFAIKLYFDVGYYGVDHIN